MHAIPFLQRSVPTHKPIFNKSASRDDDNAGVGRPTNTIAAGRSDFRRMRHFGNYRCKRNSSASNEMYHLVERRHCETGKIDGLSPILCPVPDFVGQIRKNEFDLDQIGSEKFNWIGPPGTA
jgi:hypothetical protein